MQLSKSKVPARAILIASIFAYGALAASVISPDLVFNFLISSSGALMLFIYMLIAIAQYNLRNRFEREAPERLKLRMWLHPWGTLGCVTAMGAVLVMMAVEPGRRIELGSSVAVALAFFVAWWFTRRGAVKA